MNYFLKSAVKYTGSYWEKYLQKIQKADIHYIYVEKQEDI